MVLKPRPRVNKYLDRGINSVEVRTSVEVYSSTKVPLSKKAIVRSVCLGEWPGGVDGWCGPPYGERGFTVCVMENANYSLHGSMCWSFKFYLFN